MQPPHPPPAAVDALIAGSGRCAIRRQCPPPRPPLAAPIVSRFVGSIFASLWHAKGTVRLRKGTSRMNGLFAGGFWARHALLGEIRTLKRNLGRDSYVPKIAGRDPDTANVFGQELDAQEPLSVRMSPDNVLAVRISPENPSARKSPSSIRSSSGAHRMNTAAKNPTPATRTSPP